MKSGKQRREKRRQLIPKLYNKLIIKKFLSDLRLVRTTLESREQSADEAPSEGSIVTFKMFKDK